MSSLVHPRIAGYCSTRAPLSFSLLLGLSLLWPFHWAPWLPAVPQTHQIQFLCLRVCPIYTDIGYLLRLQVSAQILAVHERYSAPRVESCSAFFLLLCSMFYLLTCSIVHTFIIAVMHTIPSPLCHSFPSLCLFFFLS